MSSWGTITTLHYTILCNTQLWKGPQKTLDNYIKITLADTLTKQHLDSKCPARPHWPIKSFHYTSTTYWSNVFRPSCFMGSKRKGSLSFQGCIRKITSHIFHILRCCSFCLCLRLLGLPKTGNNWSINFEFIFLSQNSYFFFSCCFWRSSIRRSNTYGIQT